MKKLNQLLADITAIKVVGNAEVEITSVTNDSREAKPGALFIAVKGVAVDAHKFIPQVVAAGAAAVVCEDLPENLNDTVTYIQVADSTIALAHLASAWYDHPSTKLRLVGVTGTNGKTTTATLLYELTQSLGHKAGLLSTVKNIVGPHRISSQANHPRPHVAQPSAPRNGGSRLRICVYGGEFARLRAAPHRRSAICWRHLHQPHPRPPRLPQDSGGLHQGEENVFRRLGSRCLRVGQRRRQGGQRDGAKLQGKALHLFAPHTCRLQGASD